MYQYNKGQMRLNSKARTAATVPMMKYLRRSPSELSEIRFPLRLECPALPCPPLLPLTSSWLFFHADQGRTGSEKRPLAAPLHPPPVPTISETPAIGGNLCQPLGKGLASSFHRRTPITLCIRELTAPVSQSGGWVSKTVCKMTPRSFFVSKSSI